MRNLFRHLKTINIHRKYVRKACWKVGLFWQGLVHDLSKYSITELKICKYYTGKKSPHQVCREIIGYSPSWISHYHRNKHHFQYWWDEDEEGKIIPLKMPFKYVMESFCDMVAAGKAYSIGKGVEWKCTDTWGYWQKMCVSKRIMNKESEYLLAKLIWNLREKGEVGFYKWFNANKDWLKQNYDAGTLIECDNETVRSIAV